jgi:hypothetical protein
LSFFSSREGFICDNVLNFEVVLASGEVVNANAGGNHDLWVALKGAGNNLGIVTRFDLRTFTQGPIFGGTVFYFAESFPNQLEALINELHKPNASKETHLMVSLGYSAMVDRDRIMCLNQPYFTQAVEDPPPELRPFTQIQPQIDALNSMRIHSLKDAAAEQTASGQSRVRYVEVLFSSISLLNLHFSSPYPPCPKDCILLIHSCAYMNITVKANLAVLRNAAETYSAGLEPVKPVEGGTFSLTFQPYPVSLLVSLSR